jgi:hypothetical protein
MGKKELLRNSLRDKNCNLVKTKSLAFARLFYEKSIKFYKLKEAPRLKVA